MRTIDEIHGCTLSAREVQRDTGTGCSAAQKVAFCTSTRLSKQKVHNRDKSSSFINACTIARYHTQNHVKQFLGDEQNQTSSPVDTRAAQARY